MIRGHAAQNPFPGLRPFRQDEDYLFFGREEQTMELLQRLGSHRLVAVVGTSGSGKSSLVRCGLLSELMGGKLLRAGASWQVAVTHPGGNPFGLLVEALLEADIYDREQENVREQLLAAVSRSHFGLVETIKQARLGDKTNFLLVVDQFEEIFRFNEAGQLQQEVANEYVSMLLESVAQSEVPIYVVLTMRSDFIGDCGKFEGLAEMVNRGEFLIPRLTREQYKRVIESPVKVVGGQIAPRLLQRLLNDLGQQPDQLPCLQHALMRTWTLWSEQGQTESLDLDDYQRVGRMSQALSLHADEVFDSLASDRQREISERIFQALTVQETENRGIRRPQRMDSLAKILEVPVEEIVPVIEAFRHPGVTFLMPGSDFKLTEKTIIDISHESLMRVWARLRRWVEEEAQAVGIYRRLSESAALHGQGKAGLYRDPELGIALAWRESRRPNQAWAERYHPGFAGAMQFLDASHQSRLAEEQAMEAARQRELEQARKLAEVERQRAEIEKQAASRLRGLVASVAVVAVVAVIASVVAFAFWRQSESARLAAQLSEQAATRSAEDARREADRATAQEAIAKASGEEAQENLRRARAAIDQFLIQVADSQLLSAPGLQPLRADLLESASGFYEGFLKKHPDDPALQAGLAEAFYRVGFVNVELGKYERARAALEKSVEFRSAILKTQPQDPVVRHSLATTWYELGRSRIEGKDDYVGGYEAALEAGRLWDALVKQFPENVVYKKSLARAYNLLGLSSRHPGDIERAFLAYQQSLQIRLSLLPKHQDDVEVLHGLAESFNNLGFYVSDPEQKLIMLRRSSDYNVTVHSLRPQNVEYASDVGISFGLTTQHLASMGRLKEAVATARQGVGYLLKFIRANPAVPSVRELLASNINRFRYLSIEADLADEYAQVFRDIVETYSLLPNKTAEDFVILARVQSDCVLEITRAVKTVQKREFTSKEQAEIVALRAGGVAALRQAVAAGFRDAGRLKGDPQFAALRTEQDFAALLGQIENAGSSPPATFTKIDPLLLLDEDRANGALAMGIIETGLGRIPQATQSLQETMAMRKKRAAANLGNRQLVADIEAANHAIAELYWKTGRLAEARALFEKRIDFLAQEMQKKPADSQFAVRLSVAHRSLADSLAGLALWDEAEPHYAEFLKWQPKAGIQEYLNILAPMPILLRRQQEEYRAACKQSLSKYGQDTNGEHCARLARLCALLPDAVDDTPGLLEIANRGRHHWLHYARALVLYRNGRFEDAILAIEQARKDNAELLHFHLADFVMAMSYYRLGKKGQAQDLLSALNRKTIQSMLPWTREAHNRMDVDWIILRREANELILGGAYSPEDRLRRARAFAQLGKFDKAEAECLAAPPNSTATRMVHASVLADMGRREQAEKLLAKEKSTNVVDTAYWRSCGDVLAKLGRRDDAIQAYRHAVVAQSLPVMRARERNADYALLVELSGILTDALKAAGKPEQAQAARGELKSLLSAFGLPTLLDSATDLLRQPPTEKELVDAVDRLLKADSASQAVDDLLRQEWTSLLRKRRAGLLQAKPAGEP